MAKKRVPISLRKPPSPDTVEAFVRGDEPEPAPDSGVVAHVAPVAHEPAPAGFRAHAVGDLLVGPDGAPMRPVTVYLPAAFAEELAVYCAEVDRDASRVVRDALESHFKKQLGPASVDASAPGASSSSSSSSAGGAPHHASHASAGWRDRAREFRRQAVAVTFLDGALRVLEIGQALAMRLRVQAQRA